MDSIHKEWILYRKNGFFTERMDSLQKECILYRKNAFFTERMHSIQKECILYRKNAFFTDIIELFTHIIPLEEYPASLHTTRASRSQLALRARHHFRFSNVIPDSRSPGSGSDHLFALRGNHTARASRSGFALAVISGSVTSSPICARPGLGRTTCSRCAGTTQLALRARRHFRFSNVIPDSRSPGSRFALARQ